MGKRNFLIAILIGIVIIFGVVVWAFLRPALQASAECSCTVRKQATENNR